MVESFDIDSITSYLKNPVPVTALVINPDYKELDRQHKKILSRLNASKLKFAQISLQNKEMNERETVIEPVEIWNGTQKRKAINKWK